LRPLAEILDRLSLERVASSFTRCLEWVLVDGDEFEPILVLNDVKLLTVLLPQLRGQLQPPVRICFD
jgi:hypothetical protein